MTNNNTTRSSLNQQKRNKAIAKHGAPVIVNKKNYEALKEELNLVHKSLCNLNHPLVTAYERIFKLVELFQKSIFDVDEDTSSLTCDAIYIKNKARSLECLMHDVYKTSELISEVIRDVDRNVYLTEGEHILK